MRAIKCRKTLLVPISWFVTPKDRLMLCILSSKQPVYGLYYSIPYGYRWDWDSYENPIA